jgi:hypothetical protein
MRFRAAFVSKAPMKTTHYNKRSIKQNSNRLAAYLATGIGAGIVATPMAEAAIVTIDTNGFGLDGPNAGLSPGLYTLKNDFPISGGGTICVNNNFGSWMGLYGYNGLFFAAGSNAASPVKFTLYQSISSSATWISSNYSNFKSPMDESSDFGPGSYMGFITAQGNLGWLEVTWDSVSEVFEIYSGAYESVAGVPILAGDTVGGTSAVPEPGQVASSLLLLALGAAGVAIQRQRAKKKQQAEAVSLS